MIDDQMMDVSVTLAGIWVVRATCVTPTHAAEELSFTVVSSAFV